MAHHGNLHGLTEVKIGGQELGKRNTKNEKPLVFIQKNQNRMLKRKTNKSRSEYKTEKPEILSAKDRSQK